jgi:hypothetical protein
VHAFLLENEPSAISFAVCSDQVRAMNFLCHPSFMIKLKTVITINVTLINIKSPYLLRKVYSQGCAN